jgi:SAM-dependent methyltransferase
VSLYQKLFAHSLALGDEAQHRIYGDRKRRLFADLGGTVVEIGPGTGVNLPYLPDGIRWVGLEPNPHMHDLLRPKLEGRDLDAELRTNPAQDTGLPDASVDAVISTLVLCSVPHLDETLDEVRRILRPGGRFLFIEHVAAEPGRWLRWVQSGIRPLWRPLADGCRPDRDTGAALDRAGFAEVTYERFDTGLPVVAPHIIGTAIR